MTKTDDLEAKTITELRKLSRGKVKGGYSMKKPDLIAALRAVEAGEQDTLQKMSMRERWAHFKVEKAKARTKKRMQKATEKERKIRVDDAPRAMRREHHRDTTSAGRRTAPRVISTRQPDGTVLLRSEPVSWKHTQVPPLKKRAHNRRRNKIARASRKANR